MKISVKKIYLDLFAFLCSSCPLWIIVLFFFGIILFPSNTSNNQKHFDFFMYSLSTMIGAMVSYQVSSSLKNKEQRNIFLNTGLAILRTINSQTSQLVTLQEDFKERLKLFQKFEKEKGKPIEREDLIKVVQNIRGEALIDLDIPSLYKFRVDKKILNSYEESLGNLDGWARIYRTMMEIILAINALKKAYLKTDNPSEVDLNDIDKYMNALRKYQLPDLIPQIEGAINNSLECYDNFQSTLKREFGDIPELMSKYIGKKELYKK